MPGEPHAPALTQRAKFEIDLNQLGTFLAEAFIRRVDAFTPPDRILLLQACRRRLATEGGDIVTHLLTESPPHPQPEA